MIIGIDEVGRGCWAGPLVAAAVAFEDSDAIYIKGLNDSKLLNANTRQQLVKLIQKTTRHIGIGWVWPEQINKVGLTESVRLAMNRAYEQISLTNVAVIIDGNYNFLRHVSKSQAIVKADGIVPQVSAASIIAKVTRDNYMSQLAKKYSEYGFERHVGYGTPQHIAALKEYGIISDIHRLNYKPIKKYLVEYETQNN